MSLDTVLIVNDSARLNGGTAKVAFLEAAGLVSLGYRVIFFAVTGPPDPMLCASGAEIVCLEEPDILEDTRRLRAMSKGVWNRDCADQLSRLLEGLNPDTTAIHVHSFSRALSPSVGSILSNRGFRCLLTMHEYFLACPNGGFYDYQDECICPKKPLSLACVLKNCDARSGYHKAWRVLRQLALWGPGGLPRNLKDIAYISEAQLRLMKPYLPNDARLHYILNPADLDLSSSRVHSEQNDVFLFVGRLMPEKGALDFARAAKEAGVRAVFLGDGPQKSRILEENPEAHVLGWVSSSEVTDWLRRSRALVFPSVWPEPFGLVAAEALSNGVPVIAGRWNAASEMIDSGANGLIYESRTDLPSALRKMASISTKEMSKAAFAKRESYVATPRAHCERVLSIFNRMQRMR